MDVSPLPYRTSVSQKLARNAEIDRLEALRRFQREGAVRSKLRHPNLVEMYGTFLDEYTGCTIMELFEGRSPSDMLREGPLSLHPIRQVAEQVASALGYLHGQ
jgi:serine/threonine protein kinase